VQGIEAARSGGVSVRSLQEHALLLAEITAAEAVASAGRRVGSAGRPVGSAAAGGPA
jgi:hypothetical protein